MANEKEKFTGAELLRKVVMNMDTTTESFNDRFTAMQLVQLGRMLLASDWDIYPDQWTARQVKQALRGWPPHFDENEKPVYAGDPRYPHKKPMPMEGLR